MLLLGTRNIAPQTLTTNSFVNLGAVYRKYCKKINCTKTFDFNETSVSLQQTGIYHITATIVANGTAAGDLSFNLTSNSELINGAFATESVTVATTQFRTMVIDTYVLVDSAYVLGDNSVNTQNIGIVNTGIDANVTMASLNIDKVV